MGNHYHLLMETPEANLSSGMRWLQATCFGSEEFRQGLLEKFDSFSTGAGTSEKKQEARTPLFDDVSRGYFGAASIFKAF